MICEMTHAKRKAKKSTSQFKLIVGQYEPNGNVGIEVSKRGGGQQWGGVGFSLSRKGAKALMALLKEVVR